MESQTADKLQSSWGILAECCKFPSGVGGKAPANFYSGAFWASHKASGENDYEAFLSQNTKIVRTQQCTVKSVILQLWS